MWLAVVVIALDQWTKVLAVSGLHLFESVAVIPFFNLTLMHNEGAAFSFLGDASGWKRWFLSAIALAMSIVIIVWTWRIPRHEILRPMCLSLILGGALGNLYDRLTLGYVIDFIDWYVGDWHWPAFNIADAAISIGAVTYIIHGLIVGDRQANGQDTGGSVK